MTTPDVVELCERGLPDCTVLEIVDALNEVAEEHVREAEELRTFYPRRR